MGTAWCGLNCIAVESTPSEAVSRATESLLFSWESMGGCIESRDCIWWWGQQEEYRSKTLDRYWDWCCVLCTSCEILVPRGYRPSSWFIVPQGLDRLPNTKIVVKEGLPYLLEGTAEGNIEFEFSFAIHDDFLHWNITTGLREGLKLSDSIDTSIHNKPYFFFSKLLIESRSGSNFMHQRITIIFIVDLSWRMDYLDCRFYFLTAITFLLVLDHTK